MLKPVNDKLTGFFVFKITQIDEVKYNSTLKKCFLTYVN